MHDLKRNQQTIYYSLYGEETTTDTWGNSVKSYGKQKTLKISISSNKGSAEEQMFGTELSYDRTMSTTKNLGIDENTHLWVGIKKTEPYNYKVVAVSRSLNQCVYAIKKVDINEPRD